MENVRTVSRGINLLVFLNQVGSATGSRIAAQLGLSRPSTYRILETLQACGLVYRPNRDNKYSLSWSARMLSSGLTESNRALCIATPVLYELQKSLLWPTNLATHENGEMVIIESTHPRSPYSIRTRMVGSRHPILRSALGRAYISFCAADEREEILRHFLPRCTGDSDYLASLPQIERMIERTRADGFGSLHHEIDSKTSSIAVPIMSGGRVLACMDIEWISSAMPFNSAVEKLHPPLAAACQTVEKQLTSYRPANADTLPGPLMHGIASAERPSFAAGAQ